jgi:hypothetical protein
MARQVLTMRQSKTRTEAVREEKEVRWKQGIISNGVVNKSKYETTQCTDAKIMLKNPYQN